jgi:hypothetical protein
MAGSEETNDDQTGVSSEAGTLEAAAPADVTPEVPEPLRIAAAWAWRLIVVGVVLIAIGNVLALLSPVVLPLVIALLIAAPLEDTRCRHDRAAVGGCGSRLGHCRGHLGGERL